MWSPPLFAYLVSGRSIGVLWACMSPPSHVGGRSATTSSAPIFPDDTRSVSRPSKLTPARDSSLGGLGGHHHTWPQSTSSPGCSLMNTSSALTYAPIVLRDRPNVRSDTNQLVRFWD